MTNSLQGASRPPRSAASDAGGHALLVLLEALGQQALQHACWGRLLQGGLQDESLSQQVLHLRTHHTCLHMDSICTGSANMPATVTWASQSICSYTAMEADDGFAIHKINTRTGQAPTR